MADLPVSLLDLEQGGLGAKIPMFERVDFYPHIALSLQKCCNFTTRNVHERF